MRGIFASYKNAAPRFPPGRRFEYSNTGYTILAAIIERVSGQSYEAYFHDHVFGPAGMTRTTTVSTPNAPDMAGGYVIDDRDEIVVAPPISYVTFDAGRLSPRRTTSSRGTARSRVRAS